MCIRITQFLFTIYIYIYIYTLTSLRSVCAGCTCADISSLTHPHRNSSPRVSVAQGVDEDIQSAEPPYHSKRLVGLNMFKRCSSHTLYHVSLRADLLSIYCMPLCCVALCHQTVHSLHSLSVCNIFASWYLVRNAWSCAAITSLSVSPSDLPWTGTGTRLLSSASCSCLLPIYRTCIISLHISSLRTGLTLALCVCVAFFVICEWLAVYVCVAFFVICEW